MQEAADGAMRAGGTVVGILPGDDPSRAAAGVSIPLPTGLGQARNALVVRSSEAVIALAGSWGTLSEAAFCLKLGVPLLGLRDELPRELPIERLENPEEAAELAIARAKARRERSMSAGCEGEEASVETAGEVL
jgi:predicted Rossmann-fold nucleotide-binding protein